MDKKINRVIFLTISPLSSRDYERFGIEILRENNICVEVIYIGYLIYGIKNKTDNSYLVNTIYKYEDLKEILIKHKEDSIFIKLFGLSSKIIDIDYMLYKINVRSCSLNQNIIPSTMSSIGFFQKIKIYFIILSWTNLFKKIKFLYYLKILKIQTSRYIILGGKKSDSFQNTSILKIWTHTLDYNLFLENKVMTKRIISNNYCLYLDEYIPYHPDFKKIGLDEKYKSIANIYYQKMNKFFDKIEKSYNLKVVVAAHPRAEYSELGDVWNGREVIFGKTIGLVKGAEFCMLHASTSINFAVLYKKPILFLTLKELEPLYGVFISSFSKEVGSRKIFIDDQFDKEVIDKNLFVDDVYYNDYRENYIKKSGTPEKNSWQIFADFIQIENGEIVNVQQ